MAELKQDAKQLFIEKIDGVIEFYMTQKLIYVDEIRYDIQVYQLAKELFVSVATLRRRCIKYTNKSPRIYLAEYRIEKAKRRLQQGIRSVEVAKLLAFTEHKTFCTVFKRYEKKTPSQYIQRHCK